MGGGGEIRELREKNEIASVATLVTKIVAGQQADDSTLRAQERYPEYRRIFLTGGRMIQCRPLADREIFD